MKLLQTLVEAAASKSQMAAQAILQSKEQIDFLASMSAQHLKKTFGDALFDTPMALITQHVRSYLDATLSTRLSKDDLETVTSKVLSQVKSHLNEADETEDGEELEEATKKADTKKIEAYGVKGAKSTPWRKTFKNQEAFEKWCDKNEGDIEVQGQRDLEESTVKEAVDTVHGVMAQILADELDAYEVMVRPSTPGQRAAAKIIQRMYDKYDDHFSDPEQTMLNVHEEIETEYGPHAGKAPFAEGTNVEEAAKKAPTADEDDDSKKVSTKALAKSMEDGEEEEDEDVKKADASTKDKPKKIADTSVKPAELKTAYSKLSKQIQHAVDTSNAESAFELSKELRKAFADITTEEVRQATTIWKSENK